MYCTIKNNLRLRLALHVLTCQKVFLSCEGVISLTGMPVIKKNTSNTVKRITNENTKWYKKAGNVSFVGSMIVNK